MLPLLSCSTTAEGEREGGLRFVCSSGERGRDTETRERGATVRGGGGGVEVREELMSFITKNAPKQQAPFLVDDACRLVVILIFTLEGSKFWGTSGRTNHRSPLARSF